MSYGQQMPGGFGGPGGPAGAPTVDTILSAPHARPGGVVAGKVHLRGGGSAVDVRHVTIALMPRMDNGYGGQNAGPEVYRGALTRAFRLEAGAQRDLAFSIPLPYELPFTTVLGRELPGFTIGLCTEVDTVGVPDPGDIDPISVEPLESQQWVLAAIAQLGFKIRNVSFEQSKLRGVGQQLPFYQEIQLAPPQRYRDRIGEVGLSFVASPGSVAFVLEADRRGGGGSSDETFGRFKHGHKEAAETDWPAEISKWLDQAAARSRGPVQSPGYSGTPYSSTPPNGAPLPPPPGGAAPYPPPGPAAAPSYGVPPAQHGQPAAAPGHFPPPAPAPGHAPHPAPPAPAPYAPAAHAAPPMPPGPPASYPPAHAPYPPVPAPYPPAQHGHPAPLPPAYQHRGHHHGHPGWGAAAAVGGVAAAGVAAAGVAGYAAAGPPVGQWVDQAAANVAGSAANFALDQAGQYAGEVASGVAGEVAGEAAGIVGDILGGLLGGLFG
ncbi:sporulation protein [Spirillospora sp. NPDC048911]|uniref:sporulation protein n=1 Tax=Spirillospora sp. NPDC048911 TaxID=3364527 RepID=UPI003710DE2A